MKVDSISSGSNISKTLNRYTDQLPAMWNRLPFLYVFEIDNISVIPKLLDLNTGSFLTKFYFKNNIGLSKADWWNSTNM